MATKPSKPSSATKPQPRAATPKPTRLDPAQFDQLIRYTQRDQLAVIGAIAGFLFFFTVSLFTREGGLAVYKLACTGAILFGLVGFVGGHLLLQMSGDRRPGWLKGGEGEEGAAAMREVPVKGLEPGMELAAAVVSQSGEEILPAGTILTEEQIATLRLQGVTLALIKPEEAVASQPAGPGQSAEASSPS